MEISCVSAAPGLLEALRDTPASQRYIGVLGRPKAKN